MAEIRATPTVASKPMSNGWSSILVATLVSASGLAGALAWMQQQVDRAVAMRPPIIVLDLSAAARETDPARLKALLDDYRTTAERLAGQGLLVLERQAVLAAPAGLILTEREVRHAAD